MIIVAGFLLGLGGLMMAWFLLGLFITLGDPRYEVASKGYATGGSGLVLFLIGLLLLTLFGG